MGIDLSRRKTLNHATLSLINNTTGFPINRVPLGKIIFDLSEGSFINLPGSSGRHPLGVVIESCALVIQFTSSVLTCIVSYNPTVNT